MDNFERKKIYTHSKNFKMIKKIIEIIKIIKKCRSVTFTSCSASEQ